VLSHARITEKASMHQDAKVYTFNISDRATKRDIIRAVHQIYKVTPRMVRVVTIPTKMVRHARTGKTGVKGGGKKAYVYLKSGDSIIIS
jgi:ribosomal protein L23